MRIVVVGGGLGGLALGSGLRRRGDDVVVLERDTDLRRTGGYHITLQRNVQRALSDLLTPEVYERILASAADGRLRDPDVLWDPRGRELGTVHLKSADLGVDIDRITLRTLLAEAAGDSLRPGSVCTAIERTASGPVVRLADGSSLTADLVVGADGVHSLVTRTLAGRSTSAPTGLVGISGRTPVARLDAGDRERLGVRSSLAIGPHATALYLGYLDPVGHAVLDRPDLRASVTTEPTFIWGAMLRESETTRAWARLEGTELRDAAVGMFQERGWTPAMTDVVARTEPETVGLFRFHAASERARDQAPWPAGRITALGDAVHATPPTAGMGAGAAIRDAAALVAELEAVEAGAKTMAVAISDYETGLRERGAEVVRAAMTTVRQILATDSAFGATTTRVALPALAAVHALRRQPRTPAAEREVASTSR